MLSVRRRRPAVSAGPYITGLKARCIHSSIDAFLASLARSQMAAAYAWGYATGVGFVAAGGCDPDRRAGPPRRDPGDRHADHSSHWDWTERVPWRRRGTNAMLEDK